MANNCIMTDHAPMKLEKHYICWVERRWHIPNILIETETTKRSQYSIALAILPQRPLLGFAAMTSTSVCRLLKGYISSVLLV